jgi:hypothetical protein
MKILPNYCSSFREEACRVWEDMSEAQGLKVDRHEETITEDLLLNLARKHNKRGLELTSYSKHDEGANGADWAFWFSDSAGKGIGARVQAKRLYPEGRYKSLFHQSGSQQKASGGADVPNQCETLLSHKDELIPIYAFYNSDDLDIGEALSGHQKLEWFRRCHLPFWSPDWGVAAASALAIKKVGWGKTANRPGDFPMVPWHCLVCPCCWENRPADQSLPSLIGYGLRQLYGTAASEDEVRQLGLGFEPTEHVPDWVRLLRESIGDEEPLSGLMEEMNLRGVAEFHEGE